MLNSFSSHWPTSRWVRKAQALIPLLKAQNADCMAQRQIPEQSCQALKDSGLFKMLQPKVYGGVEADPKEFFAVQLQLSTACPATGWTWGVLAVHAWQLALFSKQAQEDVWQHSPDVLLASSYAPVGKGVNVVSGGFRLSGQWDYCSGIDHCDWCLVGGLIPGDKPQYRTFLIPKSDYQIEDNWHVTGLRGSGSKSIIVNNVFVPEHRTHKVKDGFNSDSPGNLVNQAPLFRFPFGQVFIRSISTPALGMAIGAFEHYLDSMKSRVSAVSGKMAKEDPAVLEVIAHSQSEIEMLYLKMMANFDEIWGYVHQGESVPLDRRVLFKFESADTVRRCCDVIEKMIATCGASAIAQNNPLQQYYADAIATRAHFGNNARFFSRNVGQYLLDGSIKDSFL